MAFHLRPDLGFKIELAMTASQWGKGNTVDSHFRVVPNESIESGSDVFDLRRVAPVLLSGEIEYPLVGSPVYP